MKRRYAVFLVVLAGTAWPQRGPTTRPIRYPSRGTRGAVAAGTEYATEAGMRIYHQGGNAVDAGISTMFAASVSEFSHFGLGGESPILVRTKDGKVHAIAGVGTMPKLATADFFRNHKLKPDEIVGPMLLREPSYRVAVALERQTIRAYGAELPLEPDLQLQAEPVIRPTLLRRFLAGTRRVSPVA